QALEAERQQERRQDGRTHDQVDHVPLQQVAAAEQHGHGYRQSNERIDARSRPQKVGQVGGEHDQRRVRQVDDVQDAPHQREAQPDEGQNAALEQPVEDVLKEVGHEKLEVRS